VAQMTGQHGKPPVRVEFPQRLSVAPVTGV
jgi:hypothetical protein